MKRQELQAEFDRLSTQLKVIRNSVGGETPDELVSLSSQQMCVSICGSFEQCLKKIFVEYAKQRSERRIYRPIERVCESYQNPKPTKVLELIGLFDAEFEKELREQWETSHEIERSHIANLVDDRITIAHRKKVHMDVSTGKLQNYFQAYKSVLERVFDKFLG